MLTELNRDEVESLDQSRQAEPHLRQSQKRLAEELTRLVHGEAGLATALRATDMFFGAEIADLNDAQLVEIFADVPSKQLPRERLAGDGLPLIDAADRSGAGQEQRRRPPHDPAGRGLRQQSPDQRSGNTADRRPLGQRNRAGPAEWQKALCPAAIRGIVALLRQPASIRRSQGFPR